jgi:hypothetical protein
VRHFFLMLAACFCTIHAEAAGLLSTPQQRLPIRYFKCSVDADCTIVHGWCESFAIHQSHLDEYQALPKQPQGKDSENCPTDRRPAYPNAVCIHQTCAINYGQR